MKLPNPESPVRVRGGKCNFLFAQKIAPRKKSNTKVIHVVVKKFRVKTTHFFSRATKMV